MALVKFVSSLTKAQYEALATKDENTIYIPKDSNEIFKGGVCIGQKNTVTSVNSKTGAVSISLSELGGADSVELTGDVTGTSTKSGTALSIATTIANPKMTIAGNEVSLGGSLETNTLKTSLGVNNVTNESKATMFTSPTFTGTPTAPTANSGTNSTQIATTAFVQTEIKNKMETAEAMVLAGVVNANTGKLVSWNSNVLHDSDTVTLSTNTLFTSLNGNNGLRSGCVFKVNSSGEISGVKLEVGDSIVISNVSEEPDGWNVQWFVLQANIDYATSESAGIVKPNTSYGLSISDGNLAVNIDENSNGLWYGDESGGLTISLADEDNAGAMSSEDKAKLNGIESGANNYTLPNATASTLGGVKVPASGGATIGADGSIGVNVTDGNGLSKNTTTGAVSMGVASASANGAMSTTQYSWVESVRDKITHETATDSISVSKPTNFGSSISVAGNTSVDGTFEVSNESTFSDNVTFVEYVSFEGGASFSGDSYGTVTIEEIIDALTWQ